MSGAAGRLSVVRFFNTAGPCDPADHYMLPASERLSEIDGLITEKLYVVVHAPRPTGKATAIRSLARELTAGGRYAALMFSCESAAPFDEGRDDMVEAQRAILDSIRQQARLDLPEDLRPPEWPDAPGRDHASGRPGGVGAGVSASAGVVHG